MQVGMNPEAQQMAIFKTESLTYQYPERAKPAIDRIDLEINQGELVMLAGPSGCGKSTLLRLFSGLAPSFYGGKVAGEIFFKDVGIIRKGKSLAPEVGILFQDPEKQIVMTDVEREIVFGMENLGFMSEVIKMRLAEIVDFMGIKDLIGRKTYELSAGQKQKIALASVLAMNPEVLLMDEPTSQMDPISAEELLNTVRKVAEDTGKTIIMAEQKLERCLHLADRVIAMNEGKVVFNGTPKDYCIWAFHEKFEFLPLIPRLFAGMNIDTIPITVKEGRRAIGNRLLAIGKDNKERQYEVVSTNIHRAKGKIDMKKLQPEIEIKNLWFSYDGDNEILKDINIDIFKGEFVSILGQNGAGKTTFIKNINGLLKPSRGEIKIQGEKIKNKAISEVAKKVGYLGQNPDNYLLNDSVEQEILYTLNNFSMKWDESTNLLLRDMGLEAFRSVNPRDLSTGQRQRTALASVISVSPDILILDEPTRGMDYQNKRALADILKKARKQGMTIILVTHDIEFAAQVSDRVIIMFNGETVADGKSYEVLKNNLYYSPQMNKLFYGIADVMTFEEAELLIYN
jgi:energy-coupling factor transport system ATP-binding protein